MLNAAGIDSTAFDAKAYYEQLITTSSLPTLQVSDACSTIKTSLTVLSSLFYVSSTPPITAYRPPLASESPMSTSSPFSVGRGSVPV